MRARQRHFKYSSSNASMAFDTRYINDVSDNTTVQTLTDLSGNGRNVGNATAASRPTYRSRIQGGNAVLRFDGGDFYFGTATSGSAYSVYCVAKRTGSNVNGFNNATFIFSIGRDGSSSPSLRRSQFSYDDSSVFSMTSNASVAVTQTRNDNFNIHSVSAAIGSGNKSYFLNGGNEQTADVSGLAASAASMSITIGSATWSSYSFRFIGDFSLLVFYDSSHSNSLRKRIENHTALSFKIACS